MYHAGQIVHDLDANEPVVCDRRGSWVGKPVLRTSHYLITDGDRREPSIFSPTSVEQAKDLFKKGIIVPAPTPTSHCWSCQQWVDNCRCKAKQPKINQK